MIINARIQFFDDRKAKDGVAIITFVPVENLPLRALELPIVHNSPDYHYLKDLFYSGKEIEITIKEKESA